MTSLHLEPPASFSLSYPDEWGHNGMRQFEQFQLASGFSAEEDIQQIRPFYIVWEMKQRIHWLLSISLRMTERSMQELSPKFDAFLK